MKFNIVVSINNHNVIGEDDDLLIHSKKDLRNFRYDQIVEDHLYRTLIGQEIWLKLGFPYITDDNIKS